ncbi:MAG: sigma 54-interacting transcriptional regulator, partial [Bryobacteraceae bacterium]
MQPKIVALAGPLAGSSFALPAKEGCVGRAPYNWLAINSLTVSRQHFQFEWTNGGWKLTDLDSHNGTFVNDIPVKERLLANGDRIAAGDSHFVFVTEEEDLAPAPLRREGSTLRTMTVLSLDSSVPPVPPSTAAAPGVSASERRLNALLRVGEAIPAAKNHTELRAAVSAIILKALPAIRTEMYSRDDAAAEPLAAEAMRSRHAVLAEGARIRAMAVPMMVAGEVLGAIYVEGASFSDEDLELLAALTTFTALAVDSLRRVSSLQAENRRLRDESGLVHEMVGESAAMQRVYETLRKAAPTTATVLILGENGTGKELAARAIHRNSLRKDMSFVAINCATLKDTLLESELFGHEKGAFTGAVAQKIGKLEFADGGTLFLDEIGELELALQAKLLRVLQEREYERLGGLRTLTADVRLIAATNRDLIDLIKQGRFREDLFYRLNVVSFAMPALRKRRDDIPLLAS